MLFLQPARAVQAKHVLRIALGGEKFELLVALLTFVRSAHYWTLMRPELALEDDVKELLREHEELARMLLEDTEAGHCEMGTRLFEELESLRDLNERQEPERAKRALEEIGRQKDLLIKEVDHRVKNSLQIVSSLLHLQAKTAGAAASQFYDAAARVAAIATVHQQLHRYDDVGTVALDRFLIELCQGIASASSSPDRTWPLIVDAGPIIIATDIAVPLALIVNELVTNAIQHRDLPVRAGVCTLRSSSRRTTFRLAYPTPEAALRPLKPPTLALDTLDWVLELSIRWLAKSMLRSHASYQRQDIRSQ